MDSDDTVGNLFKISLASLLLVLLLEVAARAVLFSFPHLGLDPVEYTPYRIDLPDDLIPPHNKRLRPPSALLDTYERTRWVLQRTGSVLLGGLEPNLDQVWISARNHPYRVVSSSQGLRRPDSVALPKPSKTLRIYCLGDSFTFSPYLAGNESYPSLLGLALQRGGRWQRVEVLNAGVPGYFMRQEADLFITRGWKSQPDLVVLQVLDNDITGYAGKGPPGPRDPATVHPPGAIYKINLWLREHSPHLALLRIIRAIRVGLDEHYQAVRRKVRQKLMAFTPADPTRRAGRSKSLGMWYDPRKRAELRCHQAEFRRDLKRLACFCRKRGVPLVVVHFPTRDVLQKFDGGEQAVPRFFARAARDLGLPFMDLTPLFARHPQRRFLFLWPWNGHLSVMGNYLAAQALAEELPRYLGRAAGRRSS